MSGAPHSPSFSSLHLRHNSFSNPPLALPTSQLILQPFRCFTYVTAHSPTLPSLYLRHSSFSSPSVSSPKLQFILEPFFRFSYVTGFSLTSPGEPPMIYIAKALGRGRVTSPTLGRLYPRSLWYSLYRRLSVPQDQSGHGVKKILHHSDTWDQTRAVHPAVKDLAA